MQALIKKHGLVEVPNPSKQGLKPAKLDGAVRHGHR